MLLIKQIYNAIYGHHTTKESKNKKEKQQKGFSPDLAWVFVTPNPSDPRLIDRCRTMKTIYNKTNTKGHFITSSGFYRNDKREKSSVRWINSINLDFDNMDLFEVLEAIETAGLPYPSFLNQTPGGGFHAWYILKEPVRNGKNNKARVLVESIQRSMAKETGADPKAVGIERWWRIPHKDTVHVINDYIETIDINELRDWREINCPEDISDNRIAHGSVRQKGILQQPFFQKLLKGIEDGHRNHACVTLALAMKWDGLDIDTAIERLHEWNSFNTPALKSRVIENTVNWAYNSNSEGPSTRVCESIFGETFTYKTWTPTPAKAREERERSHIEEWANDIIDMLQNNEGKWEGSQRELAKLLDAPFRSIQEALKLLKNSNKLDISIEGKGRGAKTCLTLVSDAKNDEEDVNILPAVAGGENLYFPKNTNPLKLKLMTHTYNNTIARWGGGPSPP